MDILSYRNIVRVAWPIIISGLAQNLVLFADTAFLTRVGEAEVGAVGNAGMFYYIMVVVSMGISTGCQILIGRRNGEGKENEIGPLFNQLFSLQFLMAGVFLIVFALFAPMLFDWFMQSQNISDLGVDYLHYRSWGILFAATGSAFVAFYVGITKTKVLLWTTFIMSAVNIILDYGLIFGNWGFPEMGIKGAGLASGIAEVVALSVFFIYSLYTGKIKQYKLFQNLSFHKERMLSIIRIGSPIMIQGFLAMAAWFTFFMIIEKMGETELAVSHIIKSIYIVLLVPVFGYNIATSTLTSNLLGMNRHDDLFLLIRKMIGIAFVTNFLLALIPVFYPEWVLSVFTEKQNIIDFAVPVLRIVMLAMFIFSASFILFNTVNGTGNTRVSLFMELITVVLYLSLAWILVKYYQVELYQVWCAEFLYFFLLGFMAFIYLRYGKWRNTSI